MAIRMRTLVGRELHAVDGKNQEHVALAEAARMLCVPPAVIAALVKEGRLKRAFPDSDPCDDLSLQSVLDAKAHGVLVTDPARPSNLKVERRGA